MTEQRRLAAIVCADVAGYSRLMGQDESGTLATLRQHRADLWQPKIAEHGGRIVGSAGDSVLMEFSSVVAAVRCAIDIQEAMVPRNAGLPEDRRMLLRVGVNLGEVIAADETVYGDGVNVAARLQEIADPGGVCVSQAVIDTIRNQVDATFLDVGPQTLKNIVAPIRVWRWDNGAPPSEGRVARASSLALELPDKPSIAVLAFSNLSGDSEQEYFADGMVDDILTALSRFKQLFVIARNSSFTYKGRAVDVRQVGRDLGVRYVLEGSIRKAANRVRITGQLIDAPTGTHLWADRFEGKLEDIFELQDQVTMSVVGAIVHQVDQAEIERAKHRPTGNLSAYDCYLRALPMLHLPTRNGIADALQSLARAIELDPGFGRAYALAAYLHAHRRSHGWETPDVAETTRLAQRAVALGQDDGECLAMAGRPLAAIAHDLDAAAVVLDRALKLNPNLWWAWSYSGQVKTWLGEPEAALEPLAHAVRLNPRDPRNYLTLNQMAIAHFMAARYDTAAEWAAQALRARWDYPAAWRMAAASAAMAGRQAEAARAMARVRELDPTLRMSTLPRVGISVGPYRCADDVTRYREGLQRAGLPE